MTNLDDESTQKLADAEAEADASRQDLAAVATTAPAATTAGDYLRLYVQRVRGGEMGSLPATTGLIVLVILFSAIQPTFWGLYNFGNMLTEGSGPILLAMGLVFALLLGRDRPVRRLRRRRLRRGHGAADGRLRHAVAGHHRGRTAHRRRHRPADRVPSGEGAHPVVRGDAGVLPCLPGRRALHRQQRPRPARRRPHHRRARAGLRERPDAQVGGMAAGHRPRRRATRRSS